MLTRRIIRLYNGKRAKKSILRGGNTVTYTHLDVYKRQGLRNMQLRGCHGAGADKGGGIFHRSGERYAVYSVGSYDGSKNAAGTKPYFSL